jgi:hypothetical protein
MVTKEELRKEFCNIKGWSFMQFDDGVEAQEYALFLEGKIEELSKLHQPTVISSFSLPEIWKMAQKYNCDDFVKIVEEVNRLNDL